MNNSNTKNAGGRLSRLLAGALVGLALLFLVGTGVYSRPHKNNAMTRAADVVMSARPALVSEQATVQTEVQKSERSADKIKQQPAPPPSDPAQPPRPPDKAQPAQPTQPAQPPQPPEPAVTNPSDIQDKDQDKSDKQQRSADKLKKGELIEAPPPVYPDEAKKEKIEGVVSVVITIGDEGNVIYAKAKSGPELLHGASEAAALKARFKPTFLDGKPVKVSGVMSYKFVLDKKE